MGRLAFGLVAVAVAIGPAAVAAAPVAPDEQADALELAYDEAGTLHLVAHVTTNGLPNELIHRSQPPGGASSTGVNLATGFAIAGPSMELTRHPDGSTCLFFDGWRDGTDTGSAGLYLTCFRDGSWAAPVQVGEPQGVTATFDGAFTSAGEAVAVHARPTRTIGFGAVELWSVERDAGWPRLAVDGDGVLHAAWAAFTEPFAIFTSRSTDEGATWTAPESLTGEDRADVPFDFLAGPDGDVHLLVPGLPSLYRRWSGGAWSPTERPPTDIGPKRLSIGADGSPRIAWASQETVYVIDRAGGSWGEPSPVESVTTPPSDVAIAVSASGEVAVVWASGDGIGGSSTSVQGFAGAVPSPLDINLDPLVVAQSVALAAGVVLLVPLPAQVFNNTIEANAVDIRAALARWRRRLTRGREGVEGFWRRPVGIAAFFLIAALISAFLDPSLSLTLESAVTVLGLLAGLVAVAVGFSLPAILYHRLRSGGRAHVEVLPIALPIAVASVAISRLTSFEPGYLYGLLAGVTLVGSVRAGDEPRRVILTSAWTLAVVILAWFALLPVRDMAAANGPSLVAIAAEAGLATVVVAGLEGLLLGLLPISFAPGAILFRANRRAWAVLFGVAALAFFHIIVNPASGYLVDSSRVPLVTTIGLFVLFAAVTAVTWAYFRFRPRRATVPPAGAA